MKKPDALVALVVWVGVAWLVTMAVNVAMATARDETPPPAEIVEVPAPAEFGGECSRP